ncbi:FtsX-like permease family protein [Pontixanthobacter aestiaquae]|uniref:FtsX-like permease family protein n=1 Tax=Pontixanthobacter aestiaquae TaxID=1509367 RepID=A0A844Z9G3_9SPHN|nr:FtsX-like permease family protein [Pontixanthobacter aestiaquae]MDN3644853.1 FtsX-like permease family protein [Pontixanthobacter aestiaquae]MXO84144.1 FtsX-like permease family protein [Pontixanthobacter aestiaquae]
MSDTISWGTAWRIAKRDLNARFKGLRLLLVCLFLGTGALAAIGTLTGAIESELEGRGQELLGGDLEVEVWQRDLLDEEKAALEELGEISGGTRLQAMASAGENAAPIELKAVDTKWPLYGTLTLADGSEASAPTPGEAWLGQGAIDRLGISVGDTFRVGQVELTAKGIIGNEPDRLSEGFQLGPTILVSEDTPAAAGLLAPGAMYQSKYRVAFESNRSPEDVQEELEEQFPNAGFDFRTRDRASPGADRFVSRMGEFLTLVGLAALVIAGIGIGGGVSSYLEARRASIATLKVLGASSRDIARIYALQIGAAALIGSLLGLIAGVLVTPLLAAALDGLLPVDTGFVFEPAALLIAAAYGLLVALVFAATPILRARRFPAMALMRARVVPLSRDGRALTWVIGGMAGIIALALLTARQPLLSGGFLLGAIIVLGLLALLGIGIRKLSEKLPRPANPLIRNAMANLHRPGSSTSALVTALGFGLSAFVLLAAIQSSIDGNIDRRVPEQAPDYFVLDIPRDRVGEFETLVQADQPDAAIRTVPALRGAILAYGAPGNMIRVSDLEEIPDGAWPLRGERGLTYSDELPIGNSLTEGDWWSADYAGEPLVSVDQEFAAAIDLQIGDLLTVGVLGVEKTARVANFRQIDWENMGFNYVLVFSSNALADAPHNIAATIELPEGAPTGPLLRQLVKEFPSSSVIEIGQVLAEARVILSQVGLATFAAASVAVLAGLAVLIGAIAAARAARTYDTVVMRVLGASRRQVLVMQLAEYGILAIILAVVALGLGSGLAWLVITQLFEFDWLPDWLEVLAVLGGGLVFVLVFALAGSLPLLKAKPAQALRAL